MSETWIVAHDFSPCSDAAAFDVVWRSVPERRTATESRHVSSLLLRLPRRRTLAIIDSPMPSPMPREFAQESFPCRLSGSWPYSRGARVNSQAGRKGGR
jgi:hypothetical protein